PSSSRYTSAECSPSSGPTRRAAPGVSDIFTTTPGTTISPRVGWGSRWIISLASSCGWTSSWSTVKTGEHGTPAPSGPRASTTSSTVRSATHAATMPLISSLGAPRLAVPVDRVVARGAPLPPGEAGVVPRLGRAEGGGGRGEEFVAGQGDPPPPVGRTIAVVGGGAEMGVAHLLGKPPRRSE